MMRMTLMEVPTTHPKRPIMKMRPFLTNLRRKLQETKMPKGRHDAWGIRRSYYPGRSQWEAVSRTAGTMSASVDILTAPSKDTTKSNQGTVAAKATKKKKSKA